jgi:hypothetical protein
MVTIIIVSIVEKKRELEDQPLKLPRVGLSGLRMCSAPHTSLETPLIMSGSPYFVKGRRQPEARGTKVRLL